jgi:TRAP-type C4-dicarboxylate transport system permease small subunit
MPRILGWSERILDVLVAGGILVISALVFLQFSSRYVLNFSLTWSEEVATFIMIWAAMLGLVSYLRGGQLIGFSILGLIPDERAHRAGRILSDAATAVFMLLILWLGIEMSLLSRSTGVSSAAQIPLRWIYAIYPVMAIGILLRLALRWRRAGTGKDAAPQ